MADDAKGPNVNPFQPSTSPWDQSFTAASRGGTIIFPSALPPNASPLVPLVQQAAFNIAGVNSPPAFPSYWEATVIQVPLNGVNGGTTFVDQRFGTVPVETADVTTSTDTFVFGGSSMKGDGVSDPGGGLRYDTSTLWYLSSRDFTIEGWFKTSQTQNATSLVTHSDSTFTAGSWTLLFNTAASDGKLSFWSREFNAGATPLITGTLSHIDNVWHHFALVRLGSTWSLYVDGVRETAVTSGITIADGAQGLQFGGSPNFNRTLLGYMNMCRIVRGIGIYAGSAFTVPTAPFPTS